MNVQVCVGEVVAVGGLMAAEPGVRYGEKL